MVLSFTGSLFQQQDVRETPISTATATAVGLTAPTYVTLSNDADLVNERVATPGEGIDFTDGGANSTLIISGEDASTTNKGIASFNSSDFSTSSGVVSLNSKTSYASIPGAAFTENFYQDQYTTGGVGTFAVSSFGGDPLLWGAIQIPNGAVVTGATVEGSDNTNTWVLYRMTLTTAALSSMATANVDTEDTTISDATIDNSTYAYIFRVTAGVNDIVYGARVKYTTDYV